MFGLNPEYSLEELMLNASEQQWDEWESKANELEVTLDYYISEFV